MAGPADRHMAITDALAMDRLAQVIGASVRKLKLKAYGIAVPFDSAAVALIDWYHLDLGAANYQSW